MIFNVIFESLIYKPNFLGQLLENTTQILPVQSSETPVQIEPLTLAAVVGSVGLICIAVVIVIKKRRAANSS